MSNPIYGDTGSWDSTLMSNKTKGKMLVSQVGSDKFSNKTISFDDNNMLRIAYIFSTPSLLAKFPECQAAGSFFTVKMRAAKNYFDIYKANLTLVSQYDIITYLGTEVEEVKK